MTEKADIKTILRKALLLECAIHDEIKDPKIEFGFLIKIPKDNPQPFTMAVVKPKNKAWIELQHVINFVKEHKDLFNNLKEKEKNEFVLGFSKLLLGFNLDYDLHTIPEKYAMFEKIYIIDGKLDVKALLEKLKKIRIVTHRSLIYIQEQFSGDFKPSNNSTSSMPSFYT